MKRRIFACIFSLFCTLATAPAQRPDPRQAEYLDEKVNRLTAQVEDLQFQQQKTQRELESIRTEIQELRRAAGGANSSDLKALEDRIAAVDAARQADKKAIIDQLAKELAGMGRPSSPAAPGAKEYVVKSGDTLTTIAKANSVSVTELRRANGLTGDDIKVGQKLVIPR